MCLSEVALLRQQITAEYEAMKCGLTGFASGTAKHSFIDARMRRVDRYHEQLAHHIGQDDATLVICKLYDEVMS